MAMELIRGVNLEQFTQQLRPSANANCPWNWPCSSSPASRAGSAYAHAKRDKDGKLLGIVHRDVSLKNIMIGFEGDVKLTDFGIAKARGFLQDNEGEVVAGKADFMSPEQASFKITDKRSDIFSAGVVLANLLLGYNIFKGANADESRERVMTLSVPDFTRLDSRIDAQLNRILQRSMAREIGVRYPDSDELLYELEHYIYHSGYGPTNETLGKFIRELFGQNAAQPETDSRGSAILIDRTTSVGPRVPQG